MQLQTLANWMSDSTLNHYISVYSWIWPALESLHFIGLCLLFGSLLVIDLRIIGFASHASLKAIEKFIVITLVGFGINLVTGVLFLFGDPSRYFVNPAFQIKILLILLAIMNALYFPYRMRHHRTHIANIRMKKNHIEQSHNTPLPLDLKCVAGLSLLLWIGVIILGRLIPYVE